MLEGVELPALMNPSPFRMLLDGLAPCTRETPWLVGSYVRGEDTTNLLQCPPCLKSILSNFKIEIRTL